jgi:enterochelin esterase family protein
VTQTSIKANGTLTPQALADALDALAGAGPAQADRLAAGLRNWIGAEPIRKGAPPKIDGLAAAWALETDEAEAHVVADDGSFSLPLRRVGSTNVFAGAATLESGTAFLWRYEVGPERRPLMPDLGRARPQYAGKGVPLEVYAAHPDSVERPDVPKGRLIEHRAWQSRVFAGTTRDWWAYVPAQYHDDRPACVMVFQDGQNYKPFVPAVFDNLIAKGDMPVTVGVFVPPGVFADGRPNRSFEYDTLSDQYSRFILEEILPEVEKTVRLRQDAAGRAIAGISSGGICAFTAAWERPDAFSKVLSWVGSFTNIAAGENGIAGGHNYPPLIRRTPPKPIRVFLQDGKNDLNVVAGNWWLANQEMASALEFAGYDFTTAWGNGFHSNLHGRAILPDSLRWLWRTP